MLTVHHLGKSQSERIVWLCEELEIPYQLDRHEREPRTGLAPAAYKALHPLGTAPIITDNDVVLGESGAIIDYILGRYGQGRLQIAADAPGFANYVYWLHFANGTMMPTEMVAMVANVMGGDQGQRLAPLMARRTAAYRMIEDQLGRTPYLAGDSLTAADISMLFPLTTMRYFVPLDISGYPNLLAYLARIGDRPAYRRAMAKGDPNMEPLLR